MAHPVHRCICMMNWSRQQENADSYAKRMDTSAKTLREADQSLKASINNPGNESNKGLLKKSLSKVASVFRHWLQKTKKKRLQPVEVAAVL